VPDAYLEALDVSERGRRWRDRLAIVSADRRSAVLVADDDGRVVGFASSGPSEEPEAPRVASDVSAHVGEIYAIYVKPERIGTGVGRALLQHSVDVLKRLGFAEGVLWVLPENARARRFYEAAGWRPDGGETVQRIDGLELPSIRYRSTL
jgi:GNAT superfamily N-acetyltransferase